MNMKRYIVKPNGATDPMDLFLVEVDGDGYGATAKMYQRGSHPWGKEYTIDSPAIREDFSNDETVQVFKKWDGCIEISMDEHFCGSGGGAPFDQLALMMKTGAFFCNDFTEYDHEENPGITFEEFSKLDEARAEKDREKYRTYIEGPIENDAATALANRFDDVVMGISTAGSTNVSDFASFIEAISPAKPMRVVLDEPHEWARSVSYFASTADTLLPKEDKKAKRKAQKQARKQNRKK
jgi:flavodoxin